MMRGNAIGVIYASETDSKLNELTIHRTSASLPFCARYRIIDFTLSNLVNAGIISIGLITRSNYSSLMDHIRLGKDWDLSRKNGGIVMFPPYVLNNSTNFQGQVEALYGIKNYLNKRKEKYVVITPANIICKLDFVDIIDKHDKSGADITLVTYKTSSSHVSTNIVETDENGRLKDMMLTTVPNDEEKQVNLKVYVVEKEFLIKLVDEAYARGQMNFEKNIIMNNINNYYINTYLYDGYVSVIDHIKAYYDASMDMLDYDTRKEIFNKNGKVFTKVKDTAPTVYLKHASVKNSLIADGCIIDGVVENSILFRGVTVEKGAVVKNSIVMQKGLIMSNSSINYTITDKNVVIKSDRNLSGHESYPIAIAKDKTV